MEPVEPVVLNTLVVPALVGCILVLVADNYRVLLGWPAPRYEVWSRCTKVQFASAAGMEEELGEVGCMVEELVGVERTELVSEKAEHKGQASEQGRCAVAALE